MNRPGQYQKRIRDHLGQYKLERLGVTEEGIWGKNGKRYKHILPRSLLKLNILETYRKEFWSYFAELDPKISLHRDFHHLNSSQAMCFNLLFPFLNDGRKRIRFLLTALGLPDSSVEETGFEFVPDPREGTNFDFSILLRAGGRLYFEAKLSEADSGTAVQDRRHNEKFERIYKAKLEGRFLPDYCNAAHFLRNYQIMRNIWHIRAEPPDSLFFFLPRRNDLLEESTKFIRTCMLEPYQDQVEIVHLEHLLSEIEKELPGDDDRIRTHFSLFREKYFLE
jgi:hypothetical protein